MIPNGIRIISSKYPKIGIKSGIKSIGLNAYATIIMDNNLTNKGVLGCL